MSVMPLLRTRFGAAARLRIAGSAPTDEVRALARRRGIELVANPPDLSKHYRWADIAVIPLRAGGGTRIKMLEAFAHGVPVVAGRIGAEGIAVEDRRHLLLADTPETFAQACMDMLRDKTMSAGIAKNARQLIEERYAHAVGVRAIRAALAPETGAFVTAPE
jgi:glycosyltransferase involved in cell wall biosynthesis